MKSAREIRQNAQDQIRSGKMTAAEANVKMVQDERVRIVKGKLSVELRRTLNAAVKAGELGHIKKDGLRPEVYHNIHCYAEAFAAREKDYNDSLSSLRSVLA